MGRVKLVLKALAGLLALAVYIWFAAVRSLPAVKRRKAQRAARTG